MAGDGLDMSAFMGQFKEEVQELIEQTTQHLLELEKSPNATETMKEIARAVHTIKGSARLMGLEKINEITHLLEDVLVAVRDGKLAFTATMADLTFETLDLVTAATESASETGAENIETEDLCARIRQAAAGAPPVEADEDTPVLEDADDDAVQFEAEEPVEEPEDVELGEVAEIEEEAPEEPDSKPEDFKVFEKSLPQKKTKRGGKRKPPAPDAKSQPKEEPRPAPQPVPAPSAPTKERRQPVSETIRVDTAKLDSLAGVAGEMVVNLIKLEAISSTIRRIAGLSREHVRAWQQIRDALTSAGGGGLSEAGPDGSVLPVDDLVRRCDTASASCLSEIERLAQQLNEDVIRIGTSTRKLEEDVMSIRMRPVSGLFDTFPRAVRDLARELGKPVNLILEGGDTELDRKILEAIRDPLLHLVRNAVDHGIESQDERAKLDKNPEGEIRLSAWQQGDQVFVQVADDGKGIHPVAVRDSAVAKGVIDRSTADALSLQDSLRLIFEPGFSTKTTVSDLSGRGVGMDVVKSSVEDLNGEVRVDSTIGAGSSITLVLPLTLAISRALLVKSEDRTFAIPTVSVESTAKVALSDVKSVEGKAAIIVRDATVPILQLSNTLGLAPSPSAEPNGALYVVIVSYANQRFGFIVDELIGEQEIVVKRLETPLKRVTNVAGAAILGSGDVVVVLHVPDIVSGARATLLKVTARDRAPAEQVRARKRVLIVEDSLTAREMERTMFEAAGYEVETAIDGVEGLEKLEQQAVDLVVTDVQMPRMDGFELTSRLRSHDRLKNIPVVVVTSRGEEADRKRGLEVGADAYLVKSSMSQPDLLDCARRLVG